MHQNMKTGPFYVMAFRADAKTKDLIKLAQSLVWKMKLTQDSRSRALKST